LKGAFDKYASFATANVYKLLDSGPNKPNSKMETEIDVKTKLLNCSKGLCALLEEYQFKSDRPK